VDFLAFCLVLTIVDVDLTQFHRQVLKDGKHKNKTKTPGSQVAEYR
jgi:hypothetical protein